jgi:thioredoxin-like negative regulator of GroEL
MQAKLLNDLNFYQVMQSQTGVALVLFYGAHCGACKRLKALLDHYEPPAPWQLFLVDAQREGGLVEEYGVFHLPTVLLFKDGQFHRNLLLSGEINKLASEVWASLALPAQSVD